MPQNFQAIRILSSFVNSKFQIETYKKSIAFREMIDIFYFPRLNKLEFICHFLVILCACKAVRIKVWDLGWTHADAMIIR